MTTPDNDYWDRADAHHVLLSRASIGIAGAERTSAYLGIVGSDIVTEIVNAKNRRANPVVAYHDDRRSPIGFFIAGHGRHDQAERVIIYLGATERLRSRDQWRDNPVRPGSKTATLHSYGQVSELELLGQLADQLAGRDVRASRITIVPSGGPPEENLLDRDRFTSVAINLVDSLRKAGVTGIELDTRYVETERVRDQLNDHMENLRVIDGNPSGNRRRTLSEILSRTRTRPHLRRGGSMRPGRGTPT